MNIVQRVKKPTSNLFKKIKNIGVKVGAVAAYIIAVPLKLPAIVTTIAKYLGIAGNVAAIVGSNSATPDLGNTED